MADVYNFNGLGMGMGNLSQLSNAQTRSLSAENFSGLKGQGGMAVKGTEEVRISFWFWLLAGAITCYTRFLRIHTSHVCTLTIERTLHAIGTLRVADLPPVPDEVHV